jgi:hypothetical protein
MCESMVNPALTILFDLFLIGSAVAITLAMATEYFVSRQPHIGTSRPKPPVATRTPRKRATIHRMPAHRRRAA